MKHIGLLLTILFFAAEIDSAGFPVSVSGRNLLDSAGKPWFGIGDAPWALVGQVDNSQITTYLQDRGAKGYKLIMFSAPEWHYATKAPNNIDNVAPFIGAAFASALNNTYWARVDWAISEAARLGITVLICPAYLGYSSDGVSGVITGRTNQSLYDYGYALGRRYKNASNVMWLAGHDKVPNNTEKTRYRYLQDGIKAAGDTHLWVPGGWNANATYSQGTTDWGSGGPSFDVETDYDYAFKPVESLKAAWGKGSLPVVYIEGSYENERTGSQSGTTAANELRYQAWGAFVAGAVLHIYGNDPIWHFNFLSGESFWANHLNDDGAVELSYLASLMESQDWSVTAPDTGDLFLISGEGSGESLAGARYGGAIALVYMPTARAVTLDLDKLAGDVKTVTRIDPSNGSKSVLTTSAFGRYQVISQGKNAFGKSDWALLVEPTQIASPIFAPTGLRVIE